MTARQFQREMKRVGLTLDRAGDEALGAVLDVGRVTVWRWRTGNAVVPKLAALAIGAVKPTDFQSKKGARKSAARARRNTKS